MCQVNRRSVSPVPNLYSEDVEAIETHVPRRLRVKHVPHSRNNLDMLGQMAGLTFGLFR